MSIGGREINLQRWVNALLGRPPMTNGNGGGKSIDAQPKRRWNWCKLEDQILFACNTRTSTELDLYSGYIMVNKHKYRNCTHDCILF